MVTDSAMIPVESREFLVPDQGNAALVVMNELRKKRDLCDVTLCVEQQEFHAHKVVLAGCSPYLRAMFTNGMLESDKSCVVIREIAADAMDIILDYMYTGLVEVTTNNVQNLLHGASLLTLPNLRNICSQFLRLHLDPSNCLGIYTLADIYTCADLSAAAASFISHHFLEVTRHEEFLKLTDLQIVDVLRSDSLQVLSEEQVFDAALTWINWSPDDRLSAACRIMVELRLALLDTSFLEEVVLQREFVRNCPQCQKLVSEAIRTRTIDRLQIDRIAVRGDAQGVYVLGGRNSEDCQLKTMEKYDILKDRWMRMASMSVARTAVGAASLRGCVYAVGGECALDQPQGDEETLYLRCTEVYDTAAKGWRQCGEMRVARSFVTAVSLDGYIYAIGGEDKDGSFAVVERYNPHTDAWAYISPMLRKRAGCGAAVCDGKIYVAGGSDKTLQTDRATIECYDPARDKWSFVTEMDKGRSGLALIAVSNCLYVVGGRSKYMDRYDNRVEKFDLWTKDWTTVCPMNTPRAWPSVVAVDNKIYVMGGYNGTSRLRSVECYDPQADTWTFINNMNVCRAGSAGVAV